MQIVLLNFFTLLGFAMIWLSSFATAHAEPCPPGLIVREAAPKDLVCVTPESRRRAAADNARTVLLWVPGGPFGPKTCAQGYVWREAFTGDFTCVTPDVRSKTLQENTNPHGEVSP